MRVRLSYSVELDEVPETISDLIDDELGRLSYCDHVTTEIVEQLKREDPEITSCLKKIDRVRRALGALDLRLADCESLLEGYVQAIKPQEPQQVVQSGYDVNVVTPDNAGDFGVQINQTPAEDQQFDGEPK